MTKLTTASYVKITLIIALGLLILGSIGFGGCSAMRFKMMGGTEMGSANVDAASVKNLSVKWASGAVNIDVVDEGDAIELVETAPRGMTKAQQMRWSVNGDTLSIDYGTWFSCFALGRKDLQVRIPKSCAQNLGAVEIDGASGDYDVNGLGCETLKLKLASGDVDGQNPRAAASPLASRKRLVGSAAPSRFRRTATCTRAATEAPASTRAWPAASSASTPTTRKLLPRHPERAKTPRLSS